MSLEYNIKYKNGIIYKIYCKKNPYKVYIGSTHLPLSIRFKGHKYDSSFSSKLFEEFGYENCVIEVVVPFPCDNKYELEQHEMIWIIHFSNLEGYECVNFHHNKTLICYDDTRPLTKECFYKQQRKQLNHEISYYSIVKENKKNQRLMFDFFVDRSGKINPLFMWSHKRDKHTAIKLFYFVKGYEKRKCYYETREDMVRVQDRYNESKNLLTIQP